jgi:hypothetical protein
MLLPTGTVEQTAAVFAALAASHPLDAKGLAAQFKRTKTTEKKVGEVLASLARLGYVTSDDGKAFALPRVVARRMEAPTRSILFSTAVSRLSL